MIDQAGARTSDLMEEYDPAGILVWASPSMQQWLGWSPEQAAGRSAAELIHPEDRLPGLGHVLETSTAGAAPEHRHRMRRLRADGTYLWMDASLSIRHDDSGRHVATYLSSRGDGGEPSTMEELAASERRFRLLAENATDFVVLADLDGTLRWVSPTAQRLLGWDPEDLVGRPADWFIHPDDLVDLSRARDEAADGGSGVSQPRVRAADGGWRCFLASTRPLHDDDGAVIGRVTGMHDMQAETEAREQSRRAHERLQHVLASSRLGLWDWNMQTGETVFNERWAEILGYRLADLSPTTIETWTRLAHPDDLANSHDLIAAHARGDTEFYDVDARMRHRDGHWVWVRDRGRIVEWDDEGNPLRMTGTHEDITALKEAVDALAESEQLFRVAMASVPTGMAVLDPDRRIVHVNPALCGLLDRTEDWLVGRSITDILDESDKDVDGTGQGRILLTPGLCGTVEHQVRRADDTLVWVQHSISTLLGADGQVRGYVSQVSDITQARETNRRLRKLASRDPLTDLFNRRELTTRIEELLSRRVRSGTNLAVLFIDLDGLKAVNDTYGHLAGDRVLQHVAQRIRAVVRSSDVVARYGGDEFVVLLPQLHSASDAARMADHIHAVIAEAIDIEGVAISMSCSIGIASTDCGTSDPSTLLARADAAVYRAKREGRARTVVDADMTAPVIHASGR